MLQDYTPAGPTQEWDMFCLHLGVLLAADRTDRNAAVRCRPLKTSLDGACGPVAAIELCRRTFSALVVVWSR